MTILVNEANWEPERRLNKPNQQPISTCQKQVTSASVMDQLPKCSYLDVNMKVSHYWYFNDMHFGAVKYFSSRKKMSLAFWGQ